MYNKVKEVCRKQHKRTGIAARLEVLQHGCCQRNTVADLCALWVCKNLSENKHESRQNELPVRMYV